MIRHFCKDGTTNPFNCIGNQIAASLMLGGSWVSNPTIEMLEADGWVECTPAPEPQHEPTSEELIHAAIRERYSEDDEFQLLREVAAGKEGAAQRFAEYNTYVESILSRYE